MYLSQEANTPSGVQPTLWTRASSLNALASQLYLICLMVSIWLYVFGRQDKKIFFELQNLFLSSLSNPLIHTSQPCIFMQGFLFSTHRTIRMLDGEVQ